MASVAPVQTGFDQELAAGLAQHIKGLVDFPVDPQTIQIVLMHGKGIVEIAPDVMLVVTPNAPRPQVMLCDIEERLAKSRRPLQGYIERRGHGEIVDHDGFEIIDVAGIEYAASYERGVVYMRPDLVRTSKLKGFVDGWEARGNH